MCCKSWQCGDYDDDDDFDDDNDVKEEERMGLPSWRKSWQSPDDKTMILLWFPTKSCHFFVFQLGVAIFGFQLGVAIFWFPARSCHFLVFSQELPFFCFPARSCHFLDSSSELYIKIAIR